MNTYGVSSADLALAAGGEYAPTYSETAEKVLCGIGEGDLVLVLGAGTVTEVAKILCNA